MADGFTRICSSVMIPIKRDVYKRQLLILSNGAYGDRMGNIAEYHGISYDMLAFDETEQVSVSYVDDYLSHNAEITHVAVVHCETTTGVLNPLKRCV